MCEDAFTQQPGGAAQQSASCRVVALSPTAWRLHIAGHPKCSLQFAQGPSVLQSTSIHNPPCRKRDCA
eukprot:5396091-Alexandrium_andersonii.AAC.1